MKPNIPTLLLHSCCAPCSSYVIEYLREQYDLTIFYFNPNITEREEYLHRLAEQKRLVEIMNKEGHALILREGEYQVELFYASIGDGLANEPEGGERCLRCFELRLSETARLAAAEGFDYFATTLTVSPHKNADKINEIGTRLDAVHYLPSDFKKKGGYQRSIALAKQYGLYRQNYCGCEFSKR
jgi:predicted adenine nucleotide alpha hydrolase (AANH) superfamily ATPase